MANAITSTEWIVDQDSASTFNSPVTDLASPLEALNYELSWEAGVTGVFTFEGAITASRFKDLINCSTVTVTADGSESYEIVSLTGIWLTLGFVRFTWVPSGSSGDINVALRIVPK